MKLALGTVQFGLDYSISNNGGQVSPDEVKNILGYAHKMAINTLDTAQAYGNAELVLGDDTLSNEFHIISKISSQNSHPATLLASVDQSLKTLKREQLDGLLLHDSTVLLQSDGGGDSKGEAIFAQLQQAKQQGKVKKIGVSVYDPAELIELCKRFDIDMVQLPANLFDQRFLSPSMTEFIQQQQLEVHCRSAFLQGIIFCPPADLPDFFNPLKNSLQYLTDSAKNLQISPITLCLALLKKQQNINKIVVGCCTQAQLEQTVMAYQQVDVLWDKICHQVDFSAFAVADNQVINPVNWPAPSTPSSTKRGKT